MINPDSFLFRQFFGYAFMKLLSRGWEHFFSTGSRLGSGLINPPAAKPPFSVPRRCTAAIDLAVCSYGFGQWW
ncbi:MAG: hypothetical protein K2O70_00465, partial [Desulfovibrionaceae bacterium]|nr:hypothetical protein [Desulfovibrionaceae bacterium]